MTLFHREIIGTALKLGLKTKANCELSYSAIEIEDGSLVIYDLALFDPTFHTFIEKANITLDLREFPKKLKGHLDLISPHLSIVRKKDWDFEESWFDFTVKVGHGTLDWGGLAHFSLEKQEENTFISLDWDDASALITVREEEIEAELSHFPLPLIKSWVELPEITKGALSGRLKVSKDGEPIALNLGIEDVTLHVPHAAASSINGTLSYHDTLGAKWEIQAMAHAGKKDFPIKCEGRGFFKSHWLDSRIEFENSWVSVKGEESWQIECEGIQSHEIQLLQAGASLYFPELLGFQVQEGLINANATLYLPDWKVHFDAVGVKIQTDTKALKLEKVEGDLTQEGGMIALESEEGTLNLSGSWDQFEGYANILGSEVTFSASWDGERVPILIHNAIWNDFSVKGYGWINPELNLFFTLEGKWNFLEKEIPFQFPILSKSSDEWTVDFRFKRDSWDLLRIMATTDGNTVTYSEKSHFLGNPLSFAPSELKDLDITFELPFDSIQAMSPFLKEWGFDLDQWGKLGTTDVHFQLKSGNAYLFAQGEEPNFDLHVLKTKDEWRVDLNSDLKLQATLREGGLAQGIFRWKEEASAEFNGKILPSLYCEFSLPKAFLDLALIQDERLKGSVTGSGHFIYDGTIESDFDFIPSQLVINEHPMENEGPIHLNYSSVKGAQFRGVSLHGPFNCIIDLLQFDKRRGFWVLKDSQIHIPASFLKGRILEFIDKDRDLNFTADLEFAADFSTFGCKMREGLIPFQGEYHCVENLDLAWENSKCVAQFHYGAHDYRIHLQINDQITGRLIVGKDPQPLTIDWKYKDHLIVQSIEGAFGGVDASFHAEKMNRLVGSAHVDFAILSKIIPKDVGEVFEEIKMGKGYELKGRLELKDNIPTFSGILSGKAIELFGFQFRTLMAQINLSPELIRIYDVKISDFAGSLKVDDISIQKEGNDPFTIAIPNLTIKDLRPSFLLRPGEKKPGPMDPLVVRELKIHDFKGLLDESKTWTATGNLHFINSYKREETVFDYPANLLSRIAGLDLELLIPVTGDLKFDLKDGYFNLLELSNAFSEGKRSQFFLEMDPQPTMDLDGNLNIFINMKQFVLLKFTESFLISIDGVLDDPDFHLKKKKFFGIF